MSSALTEERVRRDIEVLSTAGLDIETFLMEATSSLTRAVPHVASCVATHDPVTRLLTSTRKFGHLDGVNSRDYEFGLLEYGSEETTSFSSLAVAERLAASVALSHQGDIARSPRMRDFMQAHFSFGDEARLIMRDGDRDWGSVSLFRGDDEQRFTPEQIDFLAALAPAYARGVRSGILTRMAAVETPTTAGPAVLVVDSLGRVAQETPGAGARLAEILGSRHFDPLTTVAALVGAARRYARGETTVLPRSRIRSTSGMWYVLHASPLSGGGEGRPGDVVITVEEARPPEIVALVVAAFDLTAREKDVTQLVLQGADTKEIAASLHLSTYTVQDHLKAVFDKADVRSRRELLARVFFDQYVPRMGTELSSSGFFSTH